MTKPPGTTSGSPRRPQLARQERERIVLDTAARLFYARGVHEVGMDELVRETGLGKATVYRLFPTKDVLVERYLLRLDDTIMAAIDAGRTTAESPAAALRGTLAAVREDLNRPGFRGCAFNNASIEFEASHPVRQAAASYRRSLLGRLRLMSGRLLPQDQDGAARLSSELAVLIEGAYTSAAHLGPDGPASAGLELAGRLVDEAAVRATTADRS